MKHLIPGTFMEIPAELQPKRELSRDEQAEMLALANSADLVDLDPAQIIRWWELQQQASDEQVNALPIALTEAEEFNHVITGSYGPTFTVITIMRGKIRSMGSYISGELPNALYEAERLCRAFPKGHTYIHKSETDGMDEGVIWYDGHISGVYKASGQPQQFPI